MIKHRIAQALLLCAPLLCVQPASALDFNNLLKQMNGSDNSSSNKSDAINAGINALKSAAEANRTIGPEEEKTIGDGLAANLLGGRPLVPNQPLQHYVNLVGRWVADQSELPKLDWRFGVTNDNDVNSFSTPGGAILITKGLLLKLRDEAELACILGHEITHTLKHHHTRAIQAAKGKDAFGQALQGVVAYKGGGAKQQLGANAIKGLAEVQVRGLDKKDEFEADVNGMVLCARAGYNPYALVGVLQTLDALNPQDGTVALMFATHPTPTERLTKIDEIVGDKLDSYSQGIEETARFDAIVGKMEKAAK
ncbi:M48 family metalloprotease [Andreprevotia chitinilytica]|uniref:M48 family metalloprotease n=1 Tax=Andreprevotia chitinilytica TaxID=396808 RepID=UPI00068DA792|nr:M48 family metalloprotease [Andreprevotia chitinilytica]